MSKVIEFIEDIRAVDTKATATDVTTALADKAPTVHTHTISDVTNLQTTLDGKQDTLVSGTNIKTINGTSLLGSEDVVIETPTMINNQSYFLSQI